MTDDTSTAEVSERAFLPGLLSKIGVAAGAAILTPLVVFGIDGAIVAFAVLMVALAVVVAVRRPIVFWLLTLACIPITVAWPVPGTGVVLSLPLEALVAFFVPVLIFGLLRQRHLARISYQFPAAAGDAQRPAAFSPIGMLGGLSSTTPRPPGRKHHWARHLPALATNIGEKCGLDFRMMFHPLSLVLLFQLAWMTLSTCFSVDAIVATKALVARIGYLLVFYCGALIVLDHDGDKGRLTSVTVAGLSLTVPVALWVLLNHARSGFARRECYEIAQPFFSNHTEYATVLVVWLCIVLGLRKASPGRYAWRLNLLTLLLFAAVVSAGARSAWLSLVAALLLMVVFAFKPSPWKVVGFVMMILVFLGGVFWQLNRYQMEKKASPQETISIIPIYDALLELDILSGESSMERLNRWHAAVRMLRERPFFGFGPGSYEKAYGSYQHHHELTRLSTFSGDRGGAHSELMTVAAEHGFGGVLSLVAVFCIGLMTGARAVLRAVTSQNYWLAMAWTAAFLAFVVSNLFNSLLELDKTAPLFWLVAAVLVSIDTSGVRSERYLRSASQPESS